MEVHTLGEVGILGTVLLRVSSGTILPSFIEIGSYMTDREQKINWHNFLRHRVYYYLLLFKNNSINQMVSVHIHAKHMV